MEGLSFPSLPPSCLARGVSSQLLVCSSSFLVSVWEEDLSDSLLSSPRVLVSYITSPLFKKNVIFISLLVSLCFFFISLAYFTLSFSTLLFFFHCLVWHRRLLFFVSFHIIFSLFHHLSSHLSPHASPSLPSSCFHCFSVFTILWSHSSSSTFTMKTLSLWFLLLLVFLVVSSVLWCLFHGLSALILFSPSLILIHVTCPSPSLISLIHSSSLQCVFLRFFLFLNASLAPLSSSSLVFVLQHPLRPPLSPEEPSTWMLTSIST